MIDKRRLHRIELRTTCVAVGPDAFEMELTTSDAAQLGVLPDFGWRITPSGYRLDACFADGEEFLAIEPEKSPTLQVLANEYSRRHPVRAALAALDARIRLRADR